MSFDLLHSLNKLTVQSSILIDNDFEYSLRKSNIIQT